MAVFGPIFTADNVTDGLVNMNDVLQFKYVAQVNLGVFCVFSLSDDADYR